MTQDTVIDAFVAHLRTNGYPTLQINNRPDKKNSKTPDIDAIARPFAIEHTSIDTVANQRRDSKRFLRVVDGLRNEFDNSVPCRLNITIPYEGVQTGQNWKEIKHAFRGWITNYAVNLSDGIHTIKKVPGIPFEFFVRKKTGSMPGIIFSRIAPTDNSLPDRIRKLFMRKARKLRIYKDLKYITILLVESEDVALMNEGIALEAMRTGLSCSLPDGIDRLWYVATDIPEELLFYDFTAAICKQ